MNTLRETIAAWRRTNQNSNPIKQLNIGDTLYDLKDPAVEVLADAIETRLNTVESKKIRTEELTKTSDAKFATAVTQTVDGDIDVTYGNIRDTALVDSAVTGQFVTSVSQGVDGQISLTRSGVNSENVAFTSSNGITADNVKAALEEIYADAMALKGASTDASSAETIAAAKKYADEKVQQLAGTNWTEQATTVQNIIDELSQGGLAGLDTIVDKLRGMTIPDTSEGATEGATREATSVAEYVNQKIQDVNTANTNGINALNAVVYGGSSTGTSSAGSEGETAYTNDSASKVAVKVTEVAGKITAVNVKTNDIASQSALKTLDGAVVKSVNGQTPTSGAVTIKGDNIQLSASDATLISTAIAALQTGKKNSSELVVKNVQVVDTVTRNSSECLNITLANVEVYAPVAQTNP